MATAFHIEIATPDGSVFDGQATRLICRTINGDVCIMAKHMNYCTALGMGEARVTLEDGTVRRAACIGGMLNMMNNDCRLIATTWEWVDEIDVPRAEDAKKRAEELLAKKDQLSGHEVQIAQAKLGRAMVRTGVASRK
ncbi:MAG: F0F1 ATP synthase subunit epsilon [Lachnospiraceae bacterium]|nr:F0F1 ATP synthase subunit epsilon [Lachnospiraceae bacterium]